MSSRAILENRLTGLTSRDAAMALAIVLPLAAIIAPYRAIHLPRVFLLGLALIAGLLCLKTALEDVEKLLFIFLLYIPFQKILAGDFGGIAKAVNFTNIFLILLALGWFTRVAALEKAYTAKRASGVGLLLLLFLAVTTLSMGASTLRESGRMEYSLLADLKRWLMPFAVYFLATATVSSKLTVKRMFLAVVVTTAVIGLLGVKEWWMDMGGWTRHNLEGVRIEVTSGASNLGAFFAYYLPYIVALLIANVMLLRYWLLVFPIAWCLDSLRTTFSRGALLGFLCGVAIMFFKKNKLAFLAISVVIFIFIQSSGIRLPYSIFGRMTSTYQADRPGDTLTDKLDTSSRKRITIWEGGLDMMLEHPVFGVGYGGFPAQIGTYRPSVADMDPHNNFLKIGAEMGIPALACFVLLLVACLWHAWRLYGRVEDPLLKAIILGYIGSVAGLVVANMFGSRLESAEISTQFWAMTGALVALDRIERQERLAAEREAASEDESVARPPYVEESFNAPA